MIEDDNLVRCCRELIRQDLFAFAFDVVLVLDGRVVGCQYE